MYLQMCIEFKFTNLTLCIKSPCQIELAICGGGGGGGRRTDITKCMGDTFFFFFVFFCVFLIYSPCDLRAQYKIESK